MSLHQNSSRPASSVRIEYAKVRISAVFGAMVIAACTPTQSAGGGGTGPSTADAATTAGLSAESTTSVADESMVARPAFQHRPDTQPPDTVATDNGGDLPFYARIEPDLVYHNGEWAVVYFYRPPECIPPDFDLLRFFDWPTDNDPGAMACGPPTTEGVSYWQNGPETDPAPVRAALDGRGQVPVWFVESGSYLAAINDGLTIGEIESLLVLKGTASEFREVIDPGSGISFRLSGSLDDGAAFEVQHRSGVGEPASTFIDIRR